ncbi:unnamed protein product [Heligmosomoides polygyrus]|uniref:Transposase n=1 Tax=Heligmosomoides polygyrus TaxID=6339 RepID=A0A183G4L6_HELPZ|nr:unnamed protein product [Heligmosomoides polygyrus]
MFAVKDGRSFFLWCRHWTTANHRSADRLAGAIASASRNDRAHFVKPTLAALTMGVNAEAVCHKRAAAPDAEARTLRLCPPYSSSLELRQA